MYRLVIHVKRVILFLGDILALQLALASSLFLRYGSLDAHTWELHQFPFILISVLWAIGLFVTGLYDLSRAQNSLRYFRTFLEGMFLNLLVAFAFFYLFPFFGIEPRTNLFLFFATSLFFIYGWRMIFNGFLAKGLFKTQLIFIGRSEDAMIFRDLLKQSTLGFELITILHTTPRIDHIADGIQWTDQLNLLPHLVLDNHVNGIVLGHGMEEIPALQDMLYQTLYTSVAIIDRKEIEETLTGRISLANVGKAWFLQNLRESEKSWFETAKRGIDIIVSIPFAILTILVTPFVAILMKSTSEGSVFFFQDRVGKHGKIFRIVKFRTMHHPKGQTSAETQGAQFAIKNDPRITKVGKVLRSLRIDELPQIWNVIKGDMSFIGPRPERPEFVAQLTEKMPFYALRHLVRPGLTGWAQVRYHYASTLDENLTKLQYDLYYIKYRSILLDVAILLKTINTVLRRQGT